MCIIVVKPAESTITRRTLKECYMSNTDGAGFMYAIDGVLFVLKGFFGFRRFYRHFREVERSHPNSNFVLHFRIATSGGVKAETCHPFYVHSKLAFAHNGIFSRLGNKDQSDTQEFNETILKRLPSNFLDIPKAKDMIEDYVTTSLSKIVFMNNLGEYTIMNESSGYWDGGCWFSNSGYYSYSNSGYYNTNQFGFHSTSKSLRRCISCSAWTDIKEVEWEHDLILDGQKMNGWVCKFCMEYFIKRNTRCDGCGLIGKRKDMCRTAYGELLCEDCLLINKTYAPKYSQSIMCEICLVREAVTKGEDGTSYCMTCANDCGVFKIADDYTKNSVEGSCAVCGSLVIAYKSDNWRCPNCGVYLSESDYSEELI